MGKGDNVRPHNKERFDESFERIFGKKELKTWDPGDGDHSEDDFLDMLDALQELAPGEEELVTLKTEDDPFWEDCPRADGRMEWLCPHGIGHGNHIHGCDGCCERDDYPGRKEGERKDNEPRGGNREDGMPFVAVSQESGTEANTEAPDPVEETTCPRCCHREFVERSPFDGWLCLHCGKVIEEA
jgi:hypothetical protein